MKTLRSIAGGVWLALLLLAAWEVLSRTRVLNPMFFPAPSALFAAFAALAQSGVLGHHVARTLERTAIGFGMGVFAGALASLLFSLSPALRRAAGPLVSALYATPRLTLLPMVMLLFGVNEISRLLLVALSTALLVMIQVSDAVRGVSHDYVDMAVNYGAGRLMVIRQVYLPACLPQIFTALRLSFGRALVLIVSIELLSCNDGLGSMIWSSWQTFDVEKLYVGTALAGALGLLSQWLFETLERRLVPWKEEAA